jgi:hypothetical protein
MANPKINIASLDFDSIKTSLKSYLSSLDEFAGYDFNGSGINVLLDILAYNTLYYSFYSNMIANETFLDTAKLESNIVSLVKPLGYLVTGKSSSSTEMIVKSVANTDSLTAYSDYFLGVASSGGSYRFYPIEDYSLASAAESDIKLYEGRSVAKDLPIIVDIGTQKAFLGTTDIDLNTLTVKVNGVVWTKYDTFQSNPGPDSEVYFLDRTSSGFYIIFGKKTLNDYQSSFGKDIAENDIVTVSYLIPSGTISNNISSIKNSKVTVVSSTVSGSGTDNVNLDIIKFFAPKMFAANDRAVTKDDYYGLLFASNLLPSGITQPNQVNVWGGEEADPPAFGRVFVSFADTALTTNTEAVKKSIAFLKNKAVVTVLPEYAQPQVVKINLDITATGAKSSELLGIKSLIEEYYNTIYTFNNNVLLTDIKNLIIDNYTNVRRVDINSAKMSLEITGSDAEKVMYFKNELDTSSEGIGQTVTSTNFTYNSTQISLADVPVSEAGSFLITTGIIVAVDSLNRRIQSFGSLGTVNYLTGEISINSGVIPSGKEIKIYAVPKYADSITIKNEFLANVTATVISV